MQKYKKIIVELYLEPGGKVKIELQKENKDLDEIGAVIEKIVWPYTQSKT